MFPPPIIRRPMLACSLDPLDIWRLHFPLFGSIKRDGIRCEKRQGQVLTRKWEEIPNRYIRETLEQWGGDNVEGELVVWSRTDEKIEDLGRVGSFENTETGVMNSKGKPFFHFFVWDCFDRKALPYVARLARLRKMLEEFPFTSRVSVEEQTKIINRDHLEMFHRKNTQELKFEGTVYRDPYALYKEGRATLNREELLKLKEEEEGDALIIGFKPYKQNNNEQQRDHCGYAKRSKAKAGLQVCKDRVGSFLVKWKGMQFSVAIPKPEDQRKYAKEKTQTLLKMCTFTHRGFYVSGIPKHATFKRVRRDL